MEKKRKQEDLEQDANVVVVIEPPSKFTKSLFVTPH